MSEKMEVALNRLNSKKIKEVINRWQFENLFIFSANGPSQVVSRGKKLIIMRNDFSYLKVLRFGASNGAVLGYTLSFESKGLGLGL